MKLLYLHIIILFSFSSCQNNVESKRSNDYSIIIAPSIRVEKIIKEIINPEIKMLEHLTSKFHKLSDSTFIKNPKWMIDETTSNIYCGYVIQFEEGHLFKHEEECVEWGEIITVKLKGYSPDEIRDLVEKLYKNDDYGWYENKTEYRPKESYETFWTFRIIQNKGAPELIFAYSWI